VCVCSCTGAFTDIPNNDSKTAFDLAKDPETAALLQHAGESESKSKPSTLRPSKMDVQSFALKTSILMISVWRIFLNTSLSRYLHFAGESGLTPGQHHSVFPLISSMTALVLVDMSVLHGVLPV